MHPWCSVLGTYAEYAVALAERVVSIPDDVTFEQAAAALLGSEKAVELNYSLQVTPYWLVQRVFQYYVDVGANAALANAPVLGFRAKVNF
jgi:NADPH:quinone reductase-like Zn-dependent oxidoreductase